MKGDLYECGEKTLFVGHSVDKKNYHRGSGETFTIDHLTKEQIDDLLKRGLVKKHVKDTAKEPAVPQK